MNIKRHHFIFALLALYAAFATHPSGLSAQPYDKEFYHLRAQQYLLQGNLSGALEIYNLLIGTDPTDVRAFNGRGLVFERRAELNSAMSDFEHALELNPEYAEAQHNREALLQKYKNQKPSSVDFAPQGVNYNNYIFNTARPQLNQPGQNWSSSNSGVKAGSSSFSSSTPVKPAQFPSAQGQAKSDPVAIAMERDTRFQPDGRLRASAYDIAEAESRSAMRPVTQQKPLYAGVSTRSVETAYGTDSAYLPPSMYPQPATAARVDGTTIRITSSTPAAAPVKPAKFPTAPLAQRDVGKRAPKSGITEPPIMGGISIERRAPAAATANSQITASSVRLAPMVVTQNRGNAPGMENVHAHNNAGLTFYNAGSYEYAIEEFTQAISASPEFTIAYNNRGVAYAQLGKFDLALNDFNQALRLNPYYFDAQHNREVTRPLVR